MQTICRVLLVCVNMITEITLHPLSTFTAFHQVLFKFTLQNKSTIQSDVFLIRNMHKRCFFSISDGSIYWKTMTEDVTLFVTFHGPYFMWFRGSVAEWLPTPHTIHHTCLPIHRPPSLSNSQKLCARLAISTAEIWDACNYRAIYSNQLDPNLYFPAAPAGLLASSLTSQEDVARVFAF